MCVPGVVRPMKLRAPVALAGVVSALALAQGCHRNVAPPVGLTVGDGAPITFPPADDGWSERLPLPDKASAVTLTDNRIRVSDPVLDKDGHFETKGQIIRLYFNENLVDVSKEAKKAKEKKDPELPKLTITPALPGRTVWTYGSEVEFRAEKAFDPEQEYTIELPEITAPGGFKKLEGGFKATFKTKPIVEVAGKTIYYVPKAGHLKPVAISPRDELQLGGAHALTIVYDQPIDLGLAQKLVTLTTSDGKAVPASIVHPGARSFEGQKIDTRLVLVAIPLRVPPPGSVLQITAATQLPEEKEANVSASYTIAEAPKLVEVGCGSGECEVDNLVIKGGAVSALFAKFNNPLGMGWSEAKAHVHITPSPKNLYVSAYDQLAINASFEPSTTYSVRADGMKDEYGSPVPPIAFTFKSRPLAASITMSEGVTLVDEKVAHGFPITTRNVKQGEVLLWELPKGDVGAYARALNATASTPPDGEPKVVAFTPGYSPDKTIDTLVDLDRSLERGRAYVAQVRIKEPLNGALPVSYSSGSEAGKPSSAVLFAAGPNALAAHVHHAGEKAAISVFRLATGEPVPGARVVLGASSGTTDAGGAALLLAPVVPKGESLVLAVSAADAELMMPIDHEAIAASALFPELTLPDDQKLATDAVGLVVTDRGVYRPGSQMSVKGFLRHVQGAGIIPLPGTKVRLRVVDPAGTDVADEPLVTSPRGGVTKDISFTKNGHTGRYQVRLELDDGKHTLVAAEQVRVADFEAPRFKVDVEGAKADGAHLEAKIQGRYLFGAPMGGAKVTWVIKKARVPVKGGALADAGLSFEDDRYGWWNEDKPEELKPVTGEGELKEDGSLDVNAKLETLSNGPTELTLEADVSDASARHVSGQMRTTSDPFPRHVGLKLPERFSSAGQPIHVQLGVVDQSANAVAGQRVTARLERLDWTRVSTKAQSGATLEHYAMVAKKESSCEAITGSAPVACDLPVTHGGSFRVVARLDDRDQASTSFWAYGNYTPNVSQAVPSEGKKVPLVLDKAHYEGGETAKILVQSPFAKATALITFEQGGIVEQRTLSVVGPSAKIDVPVTAANAPWLHVAVTLLPIGDPEADYRVGIVRIPVGSDDAKLDVKVTSANKVYQVRDEADITIEVKKNGQPVRNADVTLGVVDEGVLRMTAYHPKDPVNALRPGRGLDFQITDSRASLLRRREKAHTAGGGDSEGEEALDTRKNFVETAAWMPDLVTDNEGRIKTKVKLPDNLTEFRMTAVVLDEQGGGGTAESSFTVTKPLLLEPVMPRFALKGDTFEAAALVHNNTAEAVTGQVTIADQKRDVTIPPKNRARVAVTMNADRAGSRTMHFELAVNGAVKDAVEVPLRIDEAGLDEHPMVSGVFGAQQEVKLAIPADALFEDGAALSIKTGSALYPELGQRLSYLLDYPHGCVEQTTSSTIPLLAARTILPWTGTTGLEDEELKKRIDAGVARLATMQTSGGGLSYWPGESDPNTFGSAYALRALVRARDMGIQRPKLIEGVTTYLVKRLDDASSPEQRMAVAEALALVKELPSSSADSLFDQHDKLDAFGLASLAIALASLPNQDSRVKTVLDQLEEAFDADGNPTKLHDVRDWHYWGSNDRDRAQAVIALTSLRKSSKLLPVLATRLSKGLESYTTQSTAWSLLALSDYVGTRSPEGGVDVSVKLEGKILDTFKKLGGDNKEVRVPLKDIIGKQITLRLGGDPKTPSAFALEAHYKRPLAAGGTRLARRNTKGLSIHRAYSDAAGKALDLQNVKPGQIVRIAVRIDLPKLDSYRLGYLAVVDRLPAGFEPMNTDLATTGSVPDLAKDHPFYEGLAGYGSAPNHVDLRDDRVQLYFDHVYAGRALYASYLARATTPGSFTIPPGGGELMYEQDSEGYTDATQVVVK